MPVIGVCHSSGGITIGFREQAEGEQQIVEEEKKKAPFHERKVETSHSPHHKGALALEVVGAEEVAGANKEGRYRHHIGKAGHIGGSGSVCCHYKQDGEGF